jgi:spermidine synthase
LKLVARANRQKGSNELARDVGLEKSMRRDSSPPPYVTLRIAILCAILFLSGIGALIFETLWLRLSGLAFGNSVWAAALILSSFMAGLALGNTIAASAKLRRWRPLRLYAALELIVAFFGCTIVFGLPLLGEWLRPVFQTLWNQQPLLIGLRLILSFLILVVPTTAMGLTLPVVMKSPLLRHADFGRVIGSLYGWNTLGAVAGALLGEAYLVRAFGLGGTALAAGLANCTAALIAFLLPAGDQKRADLNKLQVAPRSPAKPHRPWRWLLITLGTGTILLCLEVVWFRFLLLYVASSPRAFAVMLAVVLAAIGSGGVVSAAIPRRVARSDSFLPILLLLAAMAALLSYIFFPAQAVQTDTGPFNLDAWWQIALLSLALIFPVAFVSGILFPTIVARVQGSIQDPMNSTGITTLFNTGGAAVGPLLASFVFLPSLGYQLTLVLCAASYIVLALIATRRQTWSFRRVSGWAMAALSLAAILLFAVFPYNLDQLHFAYATWPYEADEHARVLAQLVKRVEGTSDTFQLVRRDIFGRPYYYRLLTNAFSMSATNPHSQRYMRLFAYLPLALQPNARDALLLCYGCGVTADALVKAAQLQRIDVVDISKEVLGLADYYSGINYSNPLRDPRVATYVQDGRFFLQASPNQYDVITGEPPPPKVAGSVNLYTEEFFRLMNSRLKEGGMATFWLPINQLKVDETKTILRAFHNAFPNAAVWAGPDEEWIMMGIKGRGAAVTAEDIRRLWRDPRIGPDLIRIGVEVPQQMAALFLMDGEEIDRITRDTAPLTDFYPKRLSDDRWDTQASHHFAADYMEPSAAAHRFLWSPLINRIWPDALNKSLESFFAVRATRFISEVIGGNKLAELDLYLRQSRLRTPVLEVLRSNEFRLAIAEEVARQAETPPTETLPDLIAGALARRDINGAVHFLEIERDRRAGGQNDWFLLTYLYCLNGNVEKAEALAAADLASVKKDWFVDWLWKKLQDDFGFHPPS